MIFLYNNDIGFFIALIIGLIFYNIPLAILIFRTDWIEYSRMVKILKIYQRLEILDLIIRSF